MPPSNLTFLSLDIMFIIAVWILIPPDKFIQLAFLAVDRDFPSELRI